MSREKPEPFKARVSWPKTLLFALGAGGMTALCVFVIVIGGIAGLVAGVFGTTFFGLGTLMLLRPLFYAGPVVVIGSEGIFCRYWSDQVVPWRAFKRAKAPMGDKSVSLWLVDPTTFQFKLLPRLLRRIDPEKGYTADLALMTQLLNCSADDMAEAVYLHRPSLFNRRR